MLIMYHMCLTVCPLDVLSIFMKNSSSTLCMLVTSISTLANSDNPDEMPQNVAFHQGLHCLLRQNRSLEVSFEAIVGDTQYP